MQCFKIFQNNNCPYSLDKDVQKHVVMQVGLLLIAVREHMWRTMRSQLKKYYNFIIQFRL